MYNYYTNSLDYNFLFVVTVNIASRDGLFVLIRRFRVIYTHYGVIMCTFQKLFVQLS